MKKCVIAGASSRCYYMFAKTLTEEYKDDVKITGIYDPNKTRCRYFQNTISKDIKIYDDFDEMIKAEKPDIVIVTTKDSKHHEYIIRAMQSGCDAVSEKPMTMNEENVLAIMKAEKQTGKKLTVTFNCRFMPYLARLKELVKEGAVGKVLNIHYEYLLGKAHGADYFRRWHRYMENSGSLLVHKSTHHLDICNWIMEDIPKEVTALGSLHYFGENYRKEHGKRCSECKYSDSCEYFTDIKQDEFLNEMYVKAEHEDGYIRDACPFDSDIDIFDNMSVSVRYEKGALLTYTLTTYNPYEGYRISITGEKGRIEAFEAYTGEEAADPYYEIKIYNDNEEVKIIRFKKSEGTHGGGDSRLIRMIFKGGIADPLKQCAGSFDGAISALIGICAVKSIKEKRTVDIGQIIDKIKS